jgi:hypothetical protein
MREITAMIGREGQDEPPTLPEAVWVVQPLAAMGEVFIWFYADDAVGHTDRMYAMMERMLHVAVATCVGESVHPFQTSRPSTVLVAIPRASLDDIAVAGELAERIRQANGWEKPHTTKFGVVNIPRPEALPVIEEVINELAPSVVFFYAPDAVAKDPDDAMQLTGYLQGIARRHETAIVLCLTTSEEHVEQIERASSSS